MRQFVVEFDVLALFFRVLGDCFPAVRRQVVQLELQTTEFLSLVDLVDAEFGEVVQALVLDLRMKMDADGSLSHDSLNFANTFLAQLQRKNSDTLIETLPRVA